MKHSKNKIFLSLILFASAISISARPYLNNLNIRVVLGKNGDARITEVREMDIDSEGTECYISIGNLNGSELRDLQVSDETGRVFDNLGGWDINQSRSWKEGRCGIVYKQSGYEICWGLGESGSRTYTTSYTVTNLLKGYDDADGFNYMFVAQGISPYPDHVKVTIVPEDTLHFNPENTGIWGFRYRGDINFIGDSIVGETSESFGSESAMIIMCRFQKGMFEPTDVRQGSFEDLKNTAFEGSDYTEDDTFDNIIFGLFIFAFFGIPIIAGISRVYSVWQARRKLNKNLTWYRDIPLKGNLQEANDMINAYKYFGTDYNNLLSACILKLINIGAISITTHTLKNGKSAQNFIIRELPDDSNQPILLRKIHNIFKQAAGYDTVLEPQELKSYMKSTCNESIVDSFINTLHTKKNVSYYANSFGDVQQVFGLKKFLEEFTLLDERHVNEVTLWKDYMIFATLFGIADQVIKDMKKINPEYFNMDQVANQMADDMTLPMIYSTMHNSTSRATANKAAREARASGRGGHSSWGGGGGFSGGGFGGGVR